MRILHLCLACFYIDGYNYQENVLPRISKENGHDVMILASTETYVDNTVLGYLEPGEYETEYGVKIKRLPYKHVITDKISQKIRKYVGLYDEICKFRPDIIFAHDISFSSVDDVVRYLREHDDVTFLADTHTADYNSGRNWMSLHILHRLIYKRHIVKAIPYLKKYYYVGPAEREFSIKNYGIPAEIMEFLPLGGEIPDKTVRENTRLEYRRLLDSEDKLLIVHSGKLSEEKKTEDLISAFVKMKEMKAKLIIIGSIPDDRQTVLSELIRADERIDFLGWQKPDYLLKCLCAADLYCQPGSPSATLQNAICCGAAVMAQPLEGYKLLDKGNFFWVENEEDIIDVFKTICRDPDTIEKARSKSNECAHEFLDYFQMEKKITNEL